MPTKSISVYFTSYVHPQRRQRHQDHGSGRGRSWNPETGEYEASERPNTDHDGVLYVEVAE